MVYITLFLLFMYSSALKTYLCFLEKNQNFFKNMRSTKNDCISKFYGYFYNYYLLTTPGTHYIAFELNLRTPSLQKIFGILFRNVLFKNYFIFLNKRGPCTSESIRNQAPFSGESKLFFALNICKCH